MKTLINICGTSRSGSTMLDLMLGNDPKAFSLGEVHAWFRPYRKHHFQIRCSCNNEHCEYWDKIKGLPQEKFHAEAFKLLNVEFLIDSSKGLNWVIDNNIWSERNEIKVYNILIYKEILNYIFSIYKRGGTVEQALSQYIGYYTRFFQTGLPFFTVSYDKLVKDTDNSLKNICDLTGLSFFERKKYFWEKQHHQAFGSLGVRRQVETKDSAIRKDEEFSKEFIEILPNIKKMLVSNKKLYKVQEKLEGSQFELKFIESSNIHKPLWYYLHKIKESYKKYFPDEWNYNQ